MKLAGFVLLSAVGYALRCPKGGDVVKPPRIQYVNLWDTAAAGAFGEFFALDANSAGERYYKMTGAIMEYYLITFTNKDLEGDDVPNNWNAYDEKIFQFNIAQLVVDMFVNAPAKPLRVPSSPDSTTQLSSLQDAMYYALKNVPWDHREVDEEGRPIIHYIHVGTDVCPQLAGLSSHSSKGQFTGQGKFDAGELQNFDYPTAEMTATAAKSLGPNTYFHLSTVSDRPESQCGNLVEFFREEYQVKFLGGMHGWVVEEDKLPAQYASGNATYYYLNDHWTEIACLHPLKRIVCDDGKPSPPFHLQYVTLIDMYHTPKDSLATVPHMALLMSEDDEMAVYTFTNKDLDTDIEFNYCGRELTKFVAPGNAENYAISLLSGIHTNNTQYTYADSSIGVHDPHTSLQDVMYFALNGLDWIRNPVDDIGRRVVRFVHIIPSACPQEAGTSDHSSSPAWTESFFTEGRPITDCQVMDYPTKEVTSAAAQGLSGDGNTYFVITPQEAPESSCGDSVSWYRSHYLSEFLGGAKGWVDFESGTFLTDILEKRIREAICDY